MEFKFDEATLRQVVSSAIFEQLLTDDKKAELIQGAIADLLKEKEVKDGYYGTKKVSVISEAFEFAARRVASDIIREEVDKSKEFRDAVRLVLKQAIDTILTDDKIGIAAADVIANIIKTALEDYKSS